MRSPQAPIRSGYGELTTAREAVGNRQLNRRVAVVTGGHAGIGLETTRALAGAGATVVVGARAPAKARAALASLSRVEVEELDLAEPASIERFAARFVATGRPLHMLVNNAGIMATPLLRDARGFESQLATNHIGHFHLTARLWPALRAAGQAGGARVVSLSSRGHARATPGGIDFEDPHFARREYDKWRAYGESKTANSLFAVALDLRGEPFGVRAFAVHPGAIMTDLVRALPPDEQQAVRAAAAGQGTFFKTPAQGAATSVWCAANFQLDGMGGVYCEDVDVADPVPADAPGTRGVRPWAIDEEAAERLWRLSEQWTGVSY